MLEIADNSQSRDHMLNYAIAPETGTVYCYEPDIQYLFSGLSYYGWNATGFEKNKTKNLNYLTSSLQITKNSHR